MKNKIEKKALAMFSILCICGASYRSILEGMYQNASDKKQYIKASYILQIDEYQIICPLFSLN